MRLAFAWFLCAMSAGLWVRAQTLPLPARAADASAGSNFVQRAASLYSVGFALAKNVDRMAVVDRMDTMDAPEKLIPKHGGYRHLKSFQVAQLVYDVTVRFCDRYIDRRSRTRDQMTQAARRGAGYKILQKAARLPAPRKNLNLN